ncbi:MAG: hypothetical protein ISR58_14210 [Anaerolineales bacterium]|nr:hypothetical protein [Chloroflexota bacterium]MBL6982329.1 hypothetical protein [Anaerolineales bacterium]
MQVRQIDTSNPGDVRKFIRFPSTLYKGNPYWVPTMEGEMKAALNPKAHPFYQHSQAAFFVAESDKKVFGRLAVLDNKRYRQTPKKSATGLFYYFEVVEDIKVAEALFETGIHWAKEQGIDTLTGPKGLAQGDSIGILAEGFDFMPAMGIAYNMAYYPDFMERLGFEKESDLLSGYLRADEYQLPERVHQLAEKIKKRRGFHVKQFSTKDELRLWIPKVREVYNQAFATVPEFVPITEDEVWLIADKILSIADPRLLKLVFKGEDLVGFLFAYPNICKGLQKTNGRLWPFGWLHLVREFKRTKAVDINGIGLLPEHQGLGATAILYTELEKTVRDFNFEYADLVQINETNMKSFGEASNLGANWHKRHRIYAKKF